MIEFECCLGWVLEEVRFWCFSSNGDCIGWSEEIGGIIYYMLFVENGWIKDDMLVGVCEIVCIYGGDFCLILNQNLIIVGIVFEECEQVVVLFSEYGFDC